MRTLIASRHLPPHSKQGQYHRKLRHRGPLCRSSVGESASGWLIEARERHLLISMRGSRAESAACHEHRRTQTHHHQHNDRQTNVSLVPAVTSLP